MNHAHFENTNLRLSESGSLTPIDFNDPEYVKEGVYYKKFRSFIEFLSDVVLHRNLFSYHRQHLVCNSFLLRGNVLPCLY